MIPELIFALLGDPVAHSRSPAIHREALRLAGLAGDYRAIRADQARLQRAVTQLRSGELDGLNVTMPLKEHAGRMVDVITPVGRQAGSINSLRLRDGMVGGHSTDAEAFEDLIGEEGFGDASSILVLGAGGSALAVLAALGEHDDREIYLSARDLKRAERRVARFEQVRDLITWGMAVDGALVVNATPVGMGGEGLPSGVIEGAAALVDLPYGSFTTPAVQAAQTRGIPCVDGVEFLTRQALASFTWWTGKDVDFHALLRVARNV